MKWWKIKRVRLILAGYFVKHWKCFSYDSSTLFSSPLIMHVEALPENWAGWSLLWAMNTDSVSLLKHLPFCLLCISLQFDKGSHCTRGTFFGFSSPSLGFGAACWKGGGDVTDKFHFMPTTILALLFQRGGFICKPLSGEKKKKKRWKGAKLIACYTKPTRHMPVFAAFSSATVLV